MNKLTLEYEDNGKPMVLYMEFDDMDVTYETNPIFAYNSKYNDNAICDTYSEANFKITNPHNVRIKEIPTQKLISTEGVANVQSKKKRQQQNLPSP